MNPLIEQHRDELVALCRKHHVARLELFGSAATDRFDPKHSDLDFLVAFRAGSDGLTLTEFFALKEDLESLFGRSVDLVMPAAVSNPYFLAAIKSQRTAVYAA